MKPLIAIHNVALDKIETREMTDDEFAIYEAERKTLEAKIKAEAKEQAARAADRHSALEKLAALGLTEAEIQALAG